jgi:PEP-CTERM motif
VASLAWRFNLPDVFAFGFHYVSGQIDSINLVASNLAITSINTSAATGFIGLVSDSTAFYGGIGVNAVFPNNVGNDRYFIDDFRINNRAVPEPSTLGLLGIALIAGFLSSQLRSRGRLTAA